jgi:hypothetical protein
MIETLQVFIGGWWHVKVDGEWLKDKNGNCRAFKTEEAAIKAAKKKQK